MTLFKPCIDLHDGQVKQIVGGTLRDDTAEPTTNFVSAHDAGYFAGLYRRDGLEGGHVIQLGPGNRAAAEAALAAWPQGLQIGGGIDSSNAAQWFDLGASKVIVTSWLFPDARFDPNRLVQLSKAVGAERLVVDLSCRRRGDDWFVAVNRWQTITEMTLDEATLGSLEGQCSELLIHAADVEGLCSGIDEELVVHLARCCPMPCTYAGGARSLADLDRVSELSQGRVDLTIGSALDIFGGNGVRYADCVAFNKAQHS